MWCMTLDMLYRMCDMWQIEGGEHELKISGPKLWHFGSDMWHMTPDMWHLTGDTWQLTPDRWHQTCDMWHLICDMQHIVRGNILSKFQLPSFYGLGVMMFWIFGGKGRINQSVREGVKKPHLICDHDHTLPDPPPSFLRTVIALGYYFLWRCLINWLIQVCLETHFGYVWNKLWLEKAF